MSNQIVKEIHIDKVINGVIYQVITERGREGLVRADVQEEWTEVHPKKVTFVALGNDLLAGDWVTKIYEVSE